MFISVVVCTYNGADRLEAVCDSLFAQDYPKGGFEIIVVDNNSTDTTSEVCAQIAASSVSVSIRCVHEQKQGLSYARNHGVSESKGEVIAFIDDDARADVHWLSSMTVMFSDAGVHGVGGRILPDYEAPKPDWISKELESALTVLDLGDKVIDFQYPQTSPFGTNMAFRKEAFERAGMFDTRLGRIGRSLLSGEETDLFLRIARLGMRFVYAPDCIVHHKVPATRLRKSFFRKRFYSQAKSAAFLALKSSSLNNIIADDFKSLMSKFKGRKKTNNTTNSKAGFFTYEIRLIYYLSYAFFLIVYSLAGALK